jgi:hypothetical protein
MLTDEERQRIQDEERKRLLEEERYRADVRAELAKGNPSQPVNWRGSGWLIGALLALIAVGVLFAFRLFVAPATTTKTAGIQPEDPATTAPKSRIVPVTQNIASGNVTVQARGYTQYPINILQEMGNTTVSGAFSASGGNGNDIIGVIADESNFTNWINGHQTQVYWSTKGRETTGNFSVTLRPGTYHLAFSNKFSTFTAKQLSLDVRMTYHKTVPNTDLDLSVPPVRRTPVSQ